MSTLYLIRHGQAGTRQAYDSLSDLGHLQARRAGEYLASQRVRFRAAFSGTLRRQRETAEEVAGQYRACGLEFPVIDCEANWNEFDIDAVYRDMVPALAAGDPQFRRDYDDLLRQAADEDHDVHHRWSPCDAAIVSAWIEGRFPSGTESWQAFIRRVERTLDTLPRCGEDEAVAVFTSAVPIAIWVAMALGVTNGRIMQVAAVMYNSAITTFRLREGELALFSFNGVPHLPADDLRSFR
ncbi:MAG TPA: histidine phosphatase family protein [Bryobacteraceae bacterium]|nr:histidine phosphatase family protein [Bryobacteraceae bacterium]